MVHAESLIFHFHKNLSYRDPLFSTRGAIIVRKGYEHIEKIDNQLMWLDALGLQEPEKEIRRNSGIWAPDSGTCEEKATSKPCELPDGSKLYKWADREKEMQNCYFSTF